MKVLILGSTGMLGQSLKAYFENRNIVVHGVARSNSDFNLDLVREQPLLHEIIEQNQYDAVINTVALINLAYCEDNPETAYMVNTYIPGKIAEICSELDIYFIQISTDHFYTGDNDLLHSETDEIVLLNEYAKTKYLAEKLVEIQSNTLIVRTNIVGYRNNGTPTFVEWIIDSLKNNNKITGYTNMYTSSIDVDSFSGILFQLLTKNLIGIINISADGAISKFEFIRLLARKFEKDYLIEKGHLENLVVKRGNSLGLSVVKLKTSYPELYIPTVYDVIENLYQQYMSNNEER